MRKKQKAARDYVQKSKRMINDDKRGVYRTPPKRLNESKTASDKYHLSNFICPIDCFVSYLYFFHKLIKFKLMRRKFNLELHKSLNRKTALMAEEHRFSGDYSSCIKFDTHFNWQRPTLPLLRSTIGVTGFNFSVRNGKRWIPRCYSYLDHLLTYLRNLIIFFSIKRSNTPAKKLPRNDSIMIIMVKLITNSSCSMLIICCKDNSHFS